MIDHAPFGSGEPSAVPGERRVEVQLSDLPLACAAIMRETPARLALMVVEDDRLDSETFQLSYLFAQPHGTWLTVAARVPADAPAFPSVTPFVPAAHWYEREAQDMFGLTAIGHPDPRRLMLHDDWPDGVHPLRKDFDSSVPVPRVEHEPTQFHRLHGDGIIEIPVGPIHAGVIEPGHFRFAAVGEAILHLETRLFFTHRGIEKLVEGKTPQQALQVAERVCGACSCSHGVSFSQAVELIAGFPAPPRAAALRTLYLELERLYNHMGDLGNICSGVAFSVGATFGAQLKEEAQRLNERLVGNRFLHGLNRIGGVRRDLSDEQRRDVEQTIVDVAKQFQAFIELMLGSGLVVERLRNTGIVSEEVARGLGAVGPAARASGVAIDSRHDHPHAFYAELPMQPRVVVHHDGDVYSRVLVRIDEAIAAMAIVRAVLDNLPEGALAAEFDGRLGPGAAFGVTESPRGENIHWVRISDDGRMDRLRIRSASYPNWPVVAASVPGNMVPDFPLINKSFELCYACLDR